jgi:hypothetical protein
VGRECQRLMHAPTESEEPVSAALGAHPRPGGRTAIQRLFTAAEGAGWRARWHRWAGWPIEAAAQGRQLVQKSLGVVGLVLTTCPLV